MKCKKCGIEISENGVKICPKCGFFLFRDLFKELLGIIKKYYEKNDYFGVKELLNKAGLLAEGTKYESAIRIQKEEIEEKIKERNNAITELKFEAKKLYDAGDYKESLKCYRNLLALPLRKKEQSQIENELIRVKAKIYKFEMKNLFNNEEIKLFRI